MFPLGLQEQRIKPWEDTLAPGASGFDFVLLLLQFCLKSFISFIYVYICVPFKPELKCTTYGPVPAAARGHQSSLMGVRDGCEPPDVDAEN